MFSHGVAICLEGRLPASTLSAILEPHLEPLGRESLKLSIEHGKKLTLVAQADGDHPRYFDRAELFLEAASALAKHFACRAWVTAGFGGPVDCVFVDAFGSNGKRRWKGRGQKFFGRFVAEAGLKQPPFSISAPFLERGPEWKQVGALEILVRDEWTKLTGKALEAEVGIPTGKLTGWKRVESVGGIVVTHVHVALGDWDQVQRLTRMGLEEIPLRTPSFYPLALDAPVPCPDGPAVRGISSGVAGLPSVRAGREVLLRWGATVHVPSMLWLWVSSARGPFARELAALERSDRPRIKSSRLERR